MCNYYYYLLLLLLTIFHSVFTFKVKQDGNCMVQIILQQVSMKTEEVMNRYSIYLRRQVINHGLNNIDIRRPFLEKNIREIYGKYGQTLGIPFDQIRSG